MTDQRSGGQTPPAFAFIEEVTPGTSREGGEGASGTFDDIPAYIEEYIDDALKALKRQANATDVNDAADSGSTNYAPVVSTASAVHAWPRTSHAGIEKISSTTKDTASSSDDAWRCQLNAQHRPITNQTYSLDGAYFSGSPSHLHLGPTSSIDHKKPSTSRAGMVETSASLQCGARNPQTMRVHQNNAQYYTTACTSTIQGYAHNRDTGSSSFTLPVYSSSGDGKYTVASTSHAGTEEASGILGNDARIPDATGAEPWTTQYYQASGATTLYGTCGHTHVTESGITSSLHMVSSSSVNHAQPSTSHAGMEEASAIPENFARIPDATGTEPWGTHYYAASGTTTVYVLTKPSRHRSRGALSARRTQYSSLITFKGMQTVLEAEAPVSQYRSTAAAAVVGAMIQWQAQPTRACRKHRACREMKLGTLLEAEEADIKSCPVSLGMFRDGGMPYAGMTTSTQEIQPPFVKHAINDL
ncbi:uncharacterized protein [Dermacentor albipictus]|uniref:uncharacterized protein isoform X15 n=1 Tax=Dermacentor albipictus TaxID=60249 RepID=UPI0038FD270F